MKPGRYVYDIEIYKMVPDGFGGSIPDDIVRVVEGQVEVTPRAKY